MFEKEGPWALQHCSVELRAASRVAGLNSGAVWCDKLNLEVLAPYSCNVVDCFFIRNYCITCFVLNGKHQVTGVDKDTAAHSHAVSFFQTQ
jgi:hypothetical protein